MFDDMRIARLRRELEARPAARADRAPGIIEAAVALVLRPRATMELLLIRRAERHADPWSGHMALPGGRRSAGDADLYSTAMRETREEVGAGLTRHAQFVGALDEVSPQSPRLPPVLVAPFVVTVPVHAAAEPDPREVAAAMWVPLPALADEGAVDEFLIEREGSRAAFPAIRYGEHVIWGLTHRILLQFLDVAARAGL